jgi:hypothetical protein
MRHRAEQQPGGRRDQRRSRSIAKRLVGAAPITFYLQSASFSSRRSASEAQAATLALIGDGVARLARRHEVDRGEPQNDKQSGLPLARAAKRPHGRNSPDDLQRLAQPSHEI